ncbi:sigma-54 interaction domain-containing protein [Desulfosediminicola ganghwensis]|uniref:sigma-54 interaction domain-containing protein n=1 Tax=Desulfosediminicola ganghwensis TaxID=2569540 RepID=UPI001E4B7F44|nr:sigma 54-interacting transcriptional regulator [Desulfosediminicola ganghwensis]
MKDDDFFRTLAIHISNSLELSKSLRAIYDFLSREFPLVGISLHRYNQEMRSMQLDFLVTSRDFHELDQIIPMDDEDIEIIMEHEQCSLISYSPTSSHNCLAAKHQRAIAEYIPTGDRAYLVVILTAGQQTVGHFALIGETVDCFCEKHLHKLSLARIPLSLAMVNMLHYKKIKMLQQRLDEKRKQLEGEVELLRDTAIIGRDGGLRDTLKMVEQLAGKEIPVLILGETGTGKEVIADAVQRVSPRRGKPYVKVNCGAIPESLMDSELFGYEKGAFTGALTTKPGKFEQADGGTLFLDEVGELSPQAQVRLLRVLQEHVVERVGGSKSIAVDVRIIAATNRPLENMLQDGSFRDDLFYRLNVFPVTLPPLRERKQDIPLLIHTFAQEYAKRMKLSHEIQIESNSLDRLERYSWPGNIRELKNIVERALTLNNTSPVDLARHLPKDDGWYLTEQEKDGYLKKLIKEQLLEVLDGGLAKLPEHSSEKSQHEQKTELLSLDEINTRHIRNVLQHCRGKISGPGGAAEILGINPNTLRKRMQKLKIPFGGREYA